MNIQAGAGATSDCSLEHLVHLNLTGGIGAVRFRQLLAVLKTPKAILEADRETLERVPGIGPRLARRIVVSRQSVDPAREMEEAARLGCRLITCQDGLFPELLREIDDPPLVLYVWGTLEPTDKLAIAIVGARSASYYGRSQAHRIACELSARGVTVVSGLARGIDESAHRGALEGGGRTLAVLGSGVADIYPKENRKLADCILRQGALMSEYPLHARPDKGNFPRRNRIISGMTAGTLVVEASRSSGSLITARLAADQGREVFAVPGKVDSVLARGPHQLIRDGAKLVEHARDILEEVGPWMYEPAGRDEPSGSDAHTLNDREAKVYGILNSDPMDIETILQKLGYGVSEMHGILLTLEMKGLIRQMPGKRFVAS